MKDMKQLIKKISIALISVITVTVLVIFGVKTFDNKIGDNTNKPQNENNDVKENDNTSSNVKKDETKKVDEKEDKKAEKDENIVKNDTVIDTKLPSIVETSKNNNSSNNNSSNTITNNNSNNSNSNSSNSNNNNNNNNNNNTTITYKKPDVQFSLNGNTVISFKNIVNLEITGDYVEGSVYYAITNSNIILPSNSKFVKYNDSISLNNLSGVYFVWVRVIGKDGSTLYKVSNAFYMKKYTTPTISYTTDGAENVKKASTKINVTGDYDDVEYAISSSSDYSTITNWNKYTKEIEIPNNQGNLYVITRVKKSEDGKYIYKVSSVFKMLPYITPSIEFVGDGCQISPKATITIKATGDYTSLKYAISNSSDYSLIDENSWIDIQSGVTKDIPNNQGNLYVIAKLTKIEDGSTLYKVSKLFNMREYVTPSISYTYDKNGTSTVSSKASAKITATGDYTSLEYVISNSSDYNLIDEDRWIVAASEDVVNIPNDQGNLYVITRAKNLEDGKYTYKVSDMFEMVKFLTPEISYTNDGIQDAKVATTKISVTGDYKKVEYGISTIEYSYGVTNWIEYTDGDEIKIPNDQGNLYVITRVTKAEDETYIYKTSNVFKMLPYVTPNVTFSTNGSTVAQKSYDVDIALSGDYVEDSVYYAISTEANSTNILDNAWVKYEKNPINIKNINGENVTLHVKLISQKDGSTLYYRTSNKFATLPLIEISGTQPVVVTAGIDKDTLKPIKYTNYKLTNVVLHDDISKIAKIEYSFITSKGTTNGTWNGTDLDITVETEYSSTSGISLKTVLFKVTYKDGTVQSCTHVLKNQ